jgi:hypothetical protein
MIGIIARDVELIEITVYYLEVNIVQLLELSAKVCQIPLE